MEGSGIFDTYKLQVNYRSNQDILDFANIVLADIEANQYANIRLQANSLATVTVQSFKERVRLEYSPVSKLAEIDEIIRNTFHDRIVPYLKDCLDRGEQVCFLAHTRQHVGLFEEICKMEFPNANHVSLVPERAFSSTVFSSFIRHFWNEVQFMPGNQLTAIIHQEILDRLDQLLPPGTAKKAYPAVQAMLIEWAGEHGRQISAWQQQALMGAITRDELLNNVRQCMLDYEIHTNAVRQSMVSNRNQQAKENADIANANFLYCTIHSAKGLEFQNTVVLYRANNQMDEQDKRMYYVAFTRAMNSELILGYSLLKNPAIVAEYDAVVASLAQREAADSIGVDMSTIVVDKDDLAPVSTF